MNLDGDNHVLVRKEDGRWPEAAIRAVWLASCPDQNFREKSIAILDALSKLGLEGDDT